MKTNQIPWRQIFYSTLFGVGILCYGVLLRIAHETTHLNGNLRAQVVGSVSLSGKDTLAPSIAFVLPRDGVIAYNDTQVFSAIISDSHGSGIATSTAVWTITPGGRSGQVMPTGYGWIAYDANNNANIPLAEGQNIMRYTVRDRAGNSAVSEVRIFYSKYQVSEQKASEPATTAVSSTSAVQSLARGAIRIKRVGSDDTKATAPATDAWVEGIERTVPRNSPNPVNIVRLEPASYSAFASFIQGYTVTAGSCVYPRGADDRELCGVSEDEFTTEGVVCTEKKCTKEVEVQPGMVTKVVFKYEKNVQEKKYNFVIFLTDDQRWDSVDLQVDDRYVMPKVKELLIDQGVHFKNAMVTSPLCCPDRASLLSGGFLAQNTGVLSNKSPNGGAMKLNDLDTIATRLQAVGYKTAMIGKYMNGYAAPFVPAGWTKFVTTYGGNWNNYRYVEGSSSPTERSSAPEQRTTQYRTYFQRDKALEFLRENGDEPFLLYFSTNASHGPFTPAPEDKNLFSDYLYRGRGWGETDLSDKPKSVQREAREYVPRVQKEDDNNRKRLQSLVAVDRSIGAIIEEIKSKGQLENTIFIYASDNGFSWGEHGLVGKTRPHEESVRVPLIVRMPGVASRVDNNLVAANLDIGPTLYELAGISRATDGTSMVSLLRDKSAPWRREVFMEQFGHDTLGSGTWVGFRTHRWKFAEYGTGEKELYDLQADPFELQSLHAHPQYQSIVNDFSKRAAAKQGLVIERFSVPQGKVGAWYTFQLKARGGKSPYTWSFTEGSLPPGLSFNSSTGLISGAPSTQGTYSFFVDVEDMSVSKQHGGPQRFRYPVTIVIEPSSTLLQAASMASTESEIEIDPYSCKVMGWIRNSDSLQSVGYQAFVGGPKGVGVALANGISNNDIAEEDDIELSNAGGNGFHIQLPESYKDNKAHQLYIYVGQSGTLLAGMPRSFSCDK